VQGELIVVGDIADALAACCLTGRICATLGGPSVGTRSSAVAQWLISRQPTQLRAILTRSPVGDAIRTLLLDVSASTQIPLRIELLPSGITLRDIGRLHGTSAMRDWILHGAQSLVSPPEDRPARVMKARRRVSPSAPRVLGDAFDLYLAHLDRTSVPSEDVARTHRDLERFIRVATTLDLGEMEHFTADVLEHVRRLLESQERCSRNHAIHVLGCFRRMLRWLQRQGTALPDALVDFTLPRRRAMPPPAVLAARDVEGVLDAIPTKRPAGVRDRTMLELLYATAMRRVELVGLDLADVDYGQRVIRVRCGKGGTARVVPVHRRALDWVTRYVEQVRVQHLRHAEEPALFLSRNGRRMRPKMVTARMSACLHTVGLGGKGSVHVFRHTVATLMHDAGADIRDLQALLGHAVLTSTQLYTRVSLLRLQDVYGRTHPVALSTSAGR
jgi:integrase/recombinase XerD